MIVRYALKCQTCGKPHTVRIGMGHDASQTHKFPCRECSEEIVLRMNLNHDELSWSVECVENCGPIDEVAGAPIVNVDAIFIIAPELQGEDKVFPRFDYMHAMHEAAKRAKPSPLADPVPPTDRNQNRRPYRPPDYGAEWALLRRAWSLARNGQTALSEKQIAEASAEFYPPDHALENLENWIWRFASLLCTPGYGSLFDGGIDALEPLRGSPLWDDFNKFYESVAAGRGKRYFDLMKDFFQGYAEFSQVYFFVIRDIPIPEGYQTTSTDFDAVEMFCGKAYERFTSLIEYLAMLNNMLAGRPYDTFQKLTLVQYRKLDRPQRFGPFETNGPFMAICAEADNEIRNASHHSSFVFDRPKQIISYRVGKGGTGPEHRITYANYLERCVRLFLQAMTLLRIELLISKSKGIHQLV